MTEGAPLSGVSVTFTDGVLTRVGLGPGPKPDPGEVGPVHWDGSVPGRVHVKFRDGWFVGDDFSPIGTSAGRLRHEG